MTDQTEPLPPDARLSAANAARADTARLLISCPDRPGIVAAVSRFLAEQGANIVSSSQFSTDPEGGAFFMRMEFHREGLRDQDEQLRAAFAEAVAQPLGMSFTLQGVTRRKRMAIMVSRADHCLLDLLWRWRRSELDCEIPLVVSNHPDLEEDVRAFGVDWVHVPVTRADKPRAEEQMLRRLAGSVDLVVLARYMQILSGDFLDRLGVPVLNIHHSFLPSFPGADPYQQAHDRGVKIIGATAHYVIEELDAGPIIEQDVVRVRHDHTPEALMRMGRDIERAVLARAVEWHLADRILVYANKTIVF